MRGDYVPTITKVLYKRNPQWCVSSVVIMVIQGCSVLSSLDIPQIGLNQGKRDEVSNTSSRSCCTICSSCS